MTPSTLFSRRRLLVVCLAAGCLAGLSASASILGPAWQEPTPEELKMTSQPEVPGAAAVYLYREETTDDLLHMYSIYVRLKVLTEKGKDYANVELNYNRGSYTITDISGRTIHSDGTVVPFAGKPYDKLIEKTATYKYQAKVFTMPDVQVGSIIEYRYKLRYDDNIVSSPSWYIQTELYLRKGHYHFIPTQKDVVTEHDNLNQVIAWMPILPAGTEVKQIKPAAGAPSAELDVHDIAPIPDEEFMPPVRSLSYRVIFYYTAYKTPAEYWKGEGKYWSKNLDHFAGQGGEIASAVQGLVQPTDTQEVKLRKLYAAVMTIDNTDFTRAHTTVEDKAEGLGKLKTASDVWERKRGSSDQIAMVFIAMARAAGMKAYGMMVTSRDNNIFNPSLLRWSQLDDDVAIVNVDGKEVFLDPGERYCPYGQMHWKHTMANGVRQIDGGTVIAVTPPMIYTQSKIDRIADLKMDEHGVATGMVKISWTGSPALTWRHQNLTGDATSVQREMEKRVTNMLPGGMEVKFVSMANMDEYEKPLVATFDATGPVATPTGKRVLVPSQLFQSNSKPLFPHEKRDQPVYFSYPSQTSDAVRIKMPPGMAVESTPQKDVAKFGEFAVFQVSSEASGSSFLVRRTLAVNGVLFYAKEYQDLRAFYTKVATKDQEPVILKLDATQAQSGSAQVVQAGANAKSN